VSLVIVGGGGGGGGRANVVDFHGCTSIFHKYPHLLVDTPQLL
jgi:hypothetical protein